MTPLSVHHLPSPRPTQHVKKVIKSHEMPCSNHHHHYAHGCRELTRKLKHQSHLGIGTGNPWVFQGYPYPYPSLSVPAHWGTGLTRYGYRVAAGTRVRKPVPGFVF